MPIKSTTSKVTSDRNQNIMDLEKLKYPVGQRVYDEKSSNIMKGTWIRKIQDLPGKLEEATRGLSEEQLNYVYRPNGWTIAQVIHHLADSHMNAYLRCKFALTEDLPQIKGYEEAIWALLPDAMNLDIKPSMDIIGGIHTRWTQMFNAMDSTDYTKQYHHLGYHNDWELMSVLNLYAWHSDHHLAHIHQALKHKGEFGL